MKKPSAILAALVMGATTAIAGVAAAPSGKAVTAPPPVDPCAGAVSYNNVELLYAYTDFGGYLDSADGGVLRAEFSPMANLYFTASVGYDDWNTGNLWSLSAGVGGYVPLTDNIHIAADAGVLYADWEQDRYSSVTPGIINRDTVSDSDTGWYVRPHLRAKFGCLTLHAGAMYQDAGDSDDWSWFANAYYQVAQNWDLTAGYSDGDDAERITAGVRYRY